MRGESVRTTGGSPLSRATNSGDKADKATGKKMNLGDDTTTGGRTREGRRASQQTKQKSRSKLKHAGQRATLHRKKEKNTATKRSTCKEGGSNSGASKGV